MIGQTIAHYKILEKLGEGGMGVVYKAQDVKLDRYVALKFLPSNLVVSEDEIARFQHEAKAISALNHPNIEIIYDVHEENNNRFLALEYISGGTLKSSMKRLKSEDKEFSIAEVVEYGMQIAVGLAHAHNHHIIHRDVKSENVMLTEERIIKLTDFGLAKLKGTVHITKTGSTIGTLAYMSPEQLRGEDVDHRSDLFSLGVVLYELATLHLPFRGDHEAALTYSIANEEPAPVQSLRTNIPEALGNVIHRCLEKDKAKRYQSAEEVASDLKKIQQEMSGSVKTVVQHSKLPWVVAAAIVVVIVALYFLMPSSRPTSANSKTIAVLPFENMSDNKEEEYFSDGMMEDILTQLSKIGNLNVISRTSVMQYKGTKKTVREIGRELSAGVILEGSVRHSGNRVRIVGQLIDAETDKHLWAETYDREVKDIFDIQSDVAQKIAAALQAKLSSAEKERIEKKPTENLDAYAYYLKAREHANKGPKELATSIELDRKAIELDSNFALAWADLAATYAQSTTVGVPEQSRIDSSLAMSAKALSINPNLPEAFNALGIAYQNKGDVERAARSYEKAVEINPNLWQAIHNLGNIYIGRGDYVQSMRLYKKSIKLNPIASASYANLSILYVDLNDFVDARRWASKSLEFSADKVSILITLAEICLKEGKCQEAFSYMNKVLAIDSGNILNYSFAGTINILCGNAEAARTDFERTVLVDSGAFSWRNPNNTTYLGYIYLQQGKLEKAERLFNNSIKRDLQDIKDAPTEFSMEYDLAAVYAVQGNKSQAYDRFQKCIDKGFRDYRFAMLDPLFEKILKDEKFQQMMGQIKAKMDAERKKVEEFEKAEKQ
jgi:serine/threonine protein kinase/tetratricopeptide (TPR) repeat protein